MNKKKWFHVRIEFLIVVGVLLILLTVMIPRFLSAQRVSRARQLQAFVDAVMQILIENDAAILKQIEQGTFDKNVFPLAPYRTSGGSAASTTKTSTTYYYARKSVLQSYFKDYPLPRLSDDPKFGEPCFYLSIRHFTHDNTTELADFGLYAVMYEPDENVSKANPWQLMGFWGPSLHVNPEGYFHPTYYPHINFYNPSNGVSSGGIIYQNSFNAGFKIKAGTGPAIDKMKESWNLSYRRFPDSPFRF